MISQAPGNLHLPLFSNSKISDEPSLRMQKGFYFTLSHATAYVQLG